MRPRGATAARTGIAALALTAVALTGCSSDGGGSASTTSTTSGSRGEAHRAAAGVCRILVSFDDTVAEKVNAASHQITADTDPDRARELLLAATADVRRASGALPDRYDALGLTDEGDIGRLVADAAAAAADVDEQLDTITAELTDGLEGADARQILSAVFIDMEKVQSVAQPDQTDYSDPQLVEQLDTLPDCEHTISR